jgi:hypothetical protein
MNKEAARMAAKGAATDRGESGDATILIKTCK